jgi:hypothetical protein
MRIVFMVIIGVHALIHFFGFFKAFGIVQFDAISRPVSKPLGLVWLLAGLLLVLAGVLYAAKSQYWWALALVGVVISQILIFAFWKDAKFGTILNIVILIPAILDYYGSAFTTTISKERTEIMSSAGDKEGAILSEAAIAHLPGPVQHWLQASGAVGKPITQTVYLEQEAEMQMKKGDEKWSKATADQYFTVDPPAFNWSVEMEMNPFVQIAGRDKFQNGKGEMLIKIFSTIPIVNAKNSSNIDEATLQRYLAEIVWFPSAAISPHISWEAVDEYSSRATMEYQGTTGSGVFHFDQDGNFKKFTAMRFKDAESDEKLEWVVEAQKIEERNGIKVPVQCEAKWKMDGEYWTWLKLKIMGIDYNGG